MTQEPIRTILDEVVDGVHNIQNTTALAQDDVT